MLQTIHKFLLLIAVQLVFLQCSFSQADSTKPVTQTKATVDSVGEPNNQMDVFDLMRMLFKRPNLFVRKKHLDGPFIVAIPYPGYSIATGVAAVLPINISFYTNKKEHGQLSFFNNNFQYTQFNQAIAFSLSNLFFGHDRWELIGDWRYYNFPTSTYGLGSTTKLSDADNIKYSQARIYETVMRKVLNNFDAGMGYHLDYHWRISDIDGQNGVNTDFQRYGFSKSSISSGISFDLLYDSRNNSNNPKEGIYFYVQFRVNAKAFQSQSNYNSLVVDVRKYVRLPTKWYTELAFWGYLWVTTNGTPPYLDLPATGWDMYNNTGRGYALGRYRGLNMAYLEVEFRYSIMRNGFLGGVVFANAQSVSQWPSNNFAAIQPGIGLGLRIKLNKRTNTNSAVDYGFGTGGSRGFAFNLNEVF